MEYSPHHLTARDFRRESHYYLMSVNLIKTAESQKVSGHLLPVTQKAQLFRKKAPQRKNPKGRGTYPRDWGADVVGGFSSDVITSGAKPPGAAIAGERARYQHNIATSYRKLSSGELGARVVGDHPHSSTHEDSRWGHHRRWSPSCNEILEGGQLS